MRILRRRTGRLTRPQLNRAMARWLAVCMLTSSVSPVWAETLIRDGALFEQVKIHGISLDMPARAAFEHLLAAGFQAGQLRSYADWDSDGIEFVRGVYGSREGYSSLTFSRSGERIERISETYNAPGNPIDAEQEIGAMRRHFSIDDDAKKCRTVGPHRGVCEVYDAEDTHDVRHAFTLQLLTTMRIVIVYRRD